MTNTMKDADLKRNASGYYDEPCYKACTALPKPGEIWQHSRSGDYMLILAVNERVVSILKLTDRECTDGIQVVCKSVMYTSPAMVAYAFIESVGDYVKSLKEEEFKAIQTAVGKALGITAVATVPYEHILALEGQVRGLQDRNNELKLEYDELSDEAQKLKLDLDAKKMADKMVCDSIAEMEQEISKLRIYKDMYMDIIDKLVAVKVGAVND